MATLLPAGKQRYSTASGAPLVGGLLYTYDSGTTTPRATYSDAAGTTPNTNPVVLDANGEATVFWAGAYKVTLKNSAGVTQWTVDGVVSSDTTGSTDTQLRADLASTASAAKGAGMVGYSATTTYPANTVGAALRQVANVKSYGAVGNGIANDTAAFTAALVASKLVYVPEGTYLVNGVNVDYGVRIYGPGTIKTSGGTLIDLGTVDTTPQFEFRLMFVEGNLPSWEEMLDIKSLGYTVVMAYPWNIDLTVLTKNCEAVGLNVLIHSGMGTSVPSTVVPNTSLDSRPSVIGYYVLDEPALGGISIADQNRAITAYRASTAKPLYCAENSVMYGSQAISGNWDVVLADVYYANAYTTANQAIVQMIRNIAEYKSFGVSTKVIPVVGLFNDTGFEKSQSLTKQLADVLMRFSTDGSFGVFAWDAGLTAGAYVGVRNTAAYRTAAKALVKRSMAYDPYKVEMVAIGTAFGGNSKLHDVWKNTVDGASPGLPGASGCVPWEVINAGSAIDTRRQTFADSGILVIGTGGTLGFGGIPSGLCGAYFAYTNGATAATCTINLGASSTGGYTYSTAVSSGALAVGASWAGYAQLSPSDIRNMPIINVALSITTPAPYAFVKGYLAFSSAPAVSF